MTGMYFAEVFRVKIYAKHEVFLVQFPALCDGHHLTGTEIKFTA
jgi:hypothetical protein